MKKKVLGILFAASFLIGMVLISQRSYGDGDCEFGCIEAPSQSCTCVAVSCVNGNCTYTTFVIHDMLPYGGGGPEE